MGRSSQPGQPQPTVHQPRRPQHSLTRTTTRKDPPQQCQHSALHPATLHPHHRQQHSPRQHQQPVPQRTPVTPPQKCDNPLPEGRRRFQQRIPRRGLQSRPRPATHENLTPEVRIFSTYKSLSLSRIVVLRIGVKPRNQSRCVSQTAQHHHRRRRKQILRTALQLKQKILHRQLTCFVRQHIPVQHIPFTQASTDFVHLSHPARQAPRPLRRQPPNPLHPGTTRQQPTLGGSSRLEMQAWIPPQLLRISNFRPQMNGRLRLKTVPHHPHDSLLMPGKHVRLVNAVDVQRPSICGSRNNRGFQPQWSHNVIIRIRFKMQPAPAGRNPNPGLARMVTGRETQRFRGLRQCLPVPTIKQVIQLHSQMQRNSTTHRNQSC